MKKVKRSLDKIVLVTTMIVSASFKGEKKVEETALIEKK
jgi:hypothetical protein